MSKQQNGSILFSRLTGDFSSGPQLINEEDSVAISYCLITPAVASDWLANRNRGNRHLRPGVVERYASDLLNHRFGVCIQAIAFYADGGLANGQHRLQAIVRSGVAKRFIVMTGIERPDGLNIDTGLPRTLTDNARISGKDGMSIQLMAVCRAIEDGEHANNISDEKKARSNADRLDLVDQHGNAAAWAIEHGPKLKRIRNAPLLGAIGRAWYVEADKDRLHRLCEVLGSGFHKGDDETAAIVLRNYLLDTSLATTPSRWKDTFWKSQNAILYFMRRRQLRMLKRVSFEAYPLPDGQLRVIAVDRSEGTYAL